MVGVMHIFNVRQRYDNFGRLMRSLVACPCTASVHRSFYRYVNYFLIQSPFFAYSSFGGQFVFFSCFLQMLISVLHLVNISLPFPFLNFLLVMLRSAFSHHSCLLNRLCNCFCKFPCRKQWTMFVIKTCFSFWWWFGSKMISFYIFLNSHWCHVKSTIHFISFYCYSHLFSPLSIRCPLSSFILNSFYL